MSVKIDPLSRVDPSAELDEDVEVGPFCVVGPGVQLGRGCKLISHCRIDGPSVFGPDNLFYPFSSLGLETPDRKYRGEQTTLEVGRGNIFREGVTVHRGTVQGGGITRIGEENLLMPSSHVAHDCLVGNGNIMVNFSGIAGHCHMADYVMLAAHATVHQECSIGSYAFIGMNSSVTVDVLPFVSARGDPARYIGVNHVGMARHGKTPEEMRAIKVAARLLVKGRVRRKKALAQMDVMAEEFPDVGLMAEFARNSQRGLIRA